MKTFVIIACFVGLVVAQEKGDFMKKLALECNDGKELDDAFFAKGANDDNVKKVIKCILKGMKLVEDDGTFNAKKFMEMCDKHNKGAKDNCSFITECVEKSKDTADKDLALAEIGLCIRPYVMKGAKANNS